jgi:GNAT superfamily N-acetyltransferase
MRLREFAPSADRDDNDDVPNQLVVLANRWWNATDKQPQIEHVLNSLGWSIHQVESEDDAVQLQHRDGTTHFISADDFDPDLFESTKTASAKQVWDYVDRIHPDDQKGGGFLKKLILRNPQYELKRVPLSSIHIPDQEYDDEEQDPKADPYNRVQTVDPEHAGEYSANFVDRRPIVVDSQGWIIDGNHRAWAAANLLNKSDIMAWVPVNELNEISDELRRSYLDRAGRHVDRRLERIAAVRDRLNKGYEIYHADRPAGSSQIVDRFDADTPALARQYYEKFITRYESDQDFDLRLRRSTGIMEEKTLDPEEYGLELPTSTVRRIVTAVVAQVDPTARVIVKQSPEGYYLASTDNKMLRFDFGITADGGEISANIVNGYSSYKGAGVVTKIIDQCFKAMVKKYGKPSKFVISTQQDRGDGVWQAIAQKLGAEWGGSVMEIAKIPQGDFGDADTLTAPKYDVEKKPLPGGTGFTYAVGKPNAEDLEIMIFDGDTLAAELDLFYTRDATDAWRVSTVAVNPEYRSQGLGKALYGIALSVLKLTLEAGDTQTKHGQRMWLMLNSIPGVEVLGYNMERTSQYKPNPNDKIIAQDKDWTRYTFPVKPGAHGMRSARRGTSMYTSQASMIAKWTGQ